jgi:Uma2 family endonuclease
MATTTLLTAEEFAKTGHATDGCELVRGEVVQLPPPGQDHGSVCANAVHLLKTWTKAQSRGRVICNDAGIITRRDADSVRGVDVAVFLSPNWQPPQGYTSEPPDLAVEVRSPDQSWTAITDKVAEYLRMGVRLVWVIDPRRRRVTVFRPDEEPTTFAAENELDGGEVLPQFRCQVAEFFE